VTKPTRAAKKLPAELVALISAVELSHSDWWQDAVGRSLLLTLWTHGALHPDELRRKLSHSFAVEITSSELQEQLHRLSNATEVIETESGAYKVTESRSQKLVQDIERNELAESHAYESFKRVLVESVPHSDAVAMWELFTTFLLIPMIRDLGAETFRFLQGKAFDLKPSTYLQNFLSRIPERDQAAVEDVVVAFLDPAHRSARAYVINRLTTYLFLQATSWPRGTIHNLEKLTSAPARFTVFVDTNLLFSILDLHENPANEAAAALRDLRPDMAGLVNLQLYVTNETLAEARVSLESAAEWLRGIVLTRAVVEGTSSITFSGLAKRFIAQAATVEGVRDSREYFGYYIDNLMMLARAHGVEFYNEDLTPLHTEQRVIDDIMTASEVQNKRRARRGLTPKTYEQVRHDVVLWHFVYRKRDVYVESPIQANYWIVTVDYSFLGFDAYKTQQASKIVPLCVHPAPLVQMLRFWLPRGENLDAAIMRSLRLPFLFLEFDPELEAVTIRILRTVNRFQNADHLSAETIRALIMNEELRRRMSQTSDADEEVQLVQSELVIEEERLRRDLAQAAARANEAERRVALQEEAIAELGKRLDIEHRTREEAEESAQSAGARATLALGEAARAARARLAVFLLAAATLCAIPFGIGVVVARRIVPGVPMLVWIVAGFLLWTSASLLMAQWLVKWIGAAPERGAAAPLHAANQWIWGILITGLLVGILGAGLYEEVKDATREPRPSPSPTHT